MKKSLLLPSLSIFFPCYNEALNIPHFVSRALEILPRVSSKFEIIIINDGSTDESAIVAKKLASKDKRIRVISHHENQGYGKSLRTGFEAARYDWVFFTDGDLQFDLSQIRHLSVFSPKYSVIIGYRKNRADGFSRHRNALLFRLFINSLFRLNVRDIDCAFKLIKKTALDEVHLESTGAFISSELLYKLKKKGYKFKQVPVDHYPRQFGTPTGANFSVIIRAFREALRLYLHMKLGLFSNRKF